MTSVQPSSVLALNEHASVQPMGDSTLILLADSGQLFTCNESTEAFLSKVDGVRNLDQIVDAFLAEFEVARETALIDLTELAAMLLAEGVLTVR